MKKTRDISLDFVKGLAILIVMLGHSMHYNTNVSDDNILFNIIWSLQIPLFMIVSGYLGCIDFQKETHILEIIKKKSISYLLPFLSTFFIIRVILIGDYNRNLSKAIKVLVYHITSGTWFLWVVFVLAVYSIFMQLLINRFQKAIGKLVIFAGSYVLFLGGVLLVIRLCSATFLGMKYIGYYSLFYMSGLFIHVFKNRLSVCISNRYFKEICYTLCIIIYIFIIIHVNLYEDERTIFDVILRVICSLTGCYIIVRAAYFMNDDLKIKRVVAKIGNYTLELYVIHIFLVKMLCMDILPAADTLEGLVSIGANFIITFLVSALIINIIKKSTILNLIIFGKTKVKNTYGKGEHDVIRKRISNKG